MGRDHARFTLGFKKWHIRLPLYFQSSYAVNGCLSSIVAGFIFVCLHGILRNLLKTNLLIFQYTKQEIHELLVTGLPGERSTQFTLKKNLTFFYKIGLYLFNYFT